MDFLLEDNDRILLKASIDKPNSGGKVFNEAYAIFDKCASYYTNHLKQRLITQYKTRIRIYRVVDLVLCLISRYDYDLNEKKKSNRLAFKIIYQHFSRIKKAVI